MAVGVLAVFSKVVMDSSLRKALEDDKAAERPELTEPMRRLIHRVVVHAEPGVRNATAFRNL
jgi:hypothetical protein